MISPTMGGRGPMLALLALGAACEQTSEEGLSPSPVAPTPEVWYAGQTLCGLTGDQLQASALAAPAVMISSASLMAMSDLAWDAQGNLWAVGLGSDQVYRFPAASLGQSGVVEPDLVIRSGALHSPGNLAFDADGTLWVANRQSGFSPSTEGAASTEDGSIVRFAIPTGAVGTVDLTPTLRITSPPDAGDLFQVGNIGFDGARNLWVSSFSGLSRFDTPGGLQGEVSLTPQAVIDKIGYPNNIYFYSVAFDASGALWTASSDGLHHLTSITRFTDPGALTGRSSPAAAVTIMGAADALPAGGLAFDAAGDLWMATGHGLVKYTRPTDLSGAVDPAPAITVEMTGKAAPSTNSHLLFQRGRM